MDVLYKVGACSKLSKNPIFNQVKKAPLITRMWCNQATRVTWADEMTFESYILDKTIQGCL